MPRKKAVPPPPPPPPPPPALKSGFVAIVGRTNVGKSTLLNQVLGKKVSIISDKPQTTRTRILGVHTTAAGQMVFFDTPGVHRPGHELNRQMVQHIHNALQSADVILQVIDISQSFGHGEQYVLDLVQAAGRPAVLAINKIDLVKKSRILEVIDFYRQRHAFAAYVPVSALSGDGVPALTGELFGLLPPGEFFYDESFITDSPDRFMVAELVREQVLQNTRQELPFSTGVMVDLWDEGRREADGLIRIAASILVERDSQKGILIGRQGGMIKTIGSAARQEIEAFIGCRVFLELFVKVEADWRNNIHILQQMGVVR